MDTRHRARWGNFFHLTDRVSQTIERFLHIEATGGVLLLLVTVAALICANGPWSSSYFALWQMPLTLSVGESTLTTTPAFLINDGLMTIFFLLAGLEIRRELHEGALSTWQQATVPLVAAIGGVVAPALIYLMVTGDTDLRRGWAVPIATDIAFAVGVLALLGSRVPRPVRVLLLAMAIIDDIIAVLVIALFYTGELRYAGLFWVLAALLWIRAWQIFGLRSGWAYVLPGAMLWGGLLYVGVHPTLAGVVLGLMTPVVPLRDRQGLVQRSRDAIKRMLGLRLQAASNHDWVRSRQEVNDAYLDIVPPVLRAETALHPWVAFGIMPMFAFANAGVALQWSSVNSPGTVPLAVGIACGLLLGKPLGILLASLISVRLGWARLGDQIGWRGLGLVALLAGIGFTMSIFIAMLAFPSGELLATAKQAILLASGLAAIAALGYGRWAFAEHLPGKPPGQAGH